MGKNKTKINDYDSIKYTDGSGLSYDDFTLLAADLSKEVYDRESRPGGQYGYTELPQYRDESWGVYVNKKTGHGFVVFKGTDQGKEWTEQNIHIAMDTMEFAPAFDSAVQLYEKVQLENPGVTWDTAGHSLGGAKALYVAANATTSTHPHAIVYNPGMGFGALGGASKVTRFIKNSVFGTKYLTHPPQENYLVVRNKNDHVSSLYPSGANVREYENLQRTGLAGVFGLGYGPIEQHSVDQFTTKAKDDGSYNLNEITLFDILRDPKKLASPDGLHALLNAVSKANNYRQFAAGLDGGVFKEENVRLVLDELGYGADQIPATYRFLTQELRRARDFMNSDVNWTDALNYRSDRNWREFYRQEVGDVVDPLESRRVYFDVERGEFLPGEPPPETSYRFVPDHAEMYSFPGEYTPPTARRPDTSVRGFEYKQPEPKWQNDNIRPYEEWDNDDPDEKYGYEDEKDPYDAYGVENDPEPGDVFAEQSHSDFKKLMEDAMNEAVMDTNPRPEGEFGIGRYEDQLSEARPRQQGMNNVANASADVDVQEFPPGSRLEAELNAISAEREVDLTELQEMRRIFMSAGDSKTAGRYSRLIEQTEFKYNAQQDAARKKYANYEEPPDVMSDVERPPRAEMDDVANAADAADIADAAEVADVADAADVAIGGAGALEDVGAAVDIADAGIAAEAGSLALEGADAAAVGGGLTGAEAAASAASAAAIGAEAVGLGSLLLAPVVGSVELMNVADRHGQQQNLEATGVGDYMKVLTERPDFQGNRSDNLTGKAIMDVTALKAHSVSDAQWGYRLKQQFMKELPYTVKRRDANGYIQETHPFFKDRNEYNVYKKKYEISRNPYSNLPSPYVGFNQMGKVWQRDELAHRKKEIAAGGKYIGKSTTLFPSLAFGSQAGRTDNIALAMANALNMMQKAPDIKPDPKRTFDTEDKVALGVAFVPFIGTAAAYAIEANKNTQFMLDKFGKVDRNVALAGGKWEDSVWLDQSLKNDMGAAIAHASYCEKLDDYNTAYNLSYDTALRGAKNGFVDIGNTREQWDHFTNHDKLHDAVARNSGWRHGVYFYDVTDDHIYNPNDFTAKQLRERMKTGSIVSYEVGDDHVFKYHSGNDDADVINDTGVEMHQDDWEKFLNDKEANERAQKEQLDRGKKGHTFLDQIKQQDALHGVDSSKFDYDDSSKVNQNQEEDGALWPHRATPLINGVSNKRKFSGATDMKQQKMLKPAHGPHATSSLPFSDFARQFVPPAISVGGAPRRPDPTDEHRNMRGNAIHGTHNDYVPSAQTDTTYHEYDAENPVHHADTAGEHKPSMAGSEYDQALKRFFNGSASSIASRATIGQNWVEWVKTSDEAHSLASTASDLMAN